MRFREDSEVGLIPRMVVVVGVEMEVEELIAASSTSLSTSAMLESTTAGDDAIEAGLTPSEAVNAVFSSKFSSATASDVEQASVLVVLIVVVVVDAAISFLALCLVS